MKKMIAKLWIAALRSGKYKQTNGALHRIDYEGNSSFCCLGVLCDLYQQDQKKKRKRGLKVVKRRPGHVDYNNHYVFLPCAVQEWAGISSNAGVISDTTDTKICLTALNDIGFDFEQIASVIEKNMENL